MEPNVAPRSANNVTGQVIDMSKALTKNPPTFIPVDTKPNTAISTTITQKENLVNSDDNIKLIPLTVL